MASILAFPRKFFAESPHTPQRTSPSAEEAAFNRPRFGLNLGNRVCDSILHGRPSLQMTSQVGLAVAHIDLEISHLTARARLRLMTQAVRTSAADPA